MKVYEYPDWENTVILVNEGIKKKYGDPYLCGEEFINILKDSVVDALNTLCISSGERCMVIRILEGGRFYYVYEALNNLLENKPLLGEIDIKSRILYDPEDVVTKVIRDEGICKKAGETGLILIGDTVASGKTMLTLLDRLSPCLKKDTQFVILGFVTYYGLDRVRDWFVERGLKYNFIGYGGLLGLGRNLTDMTIGDEPNYIPDEIKRYSESMLGAEIANKLCVVGDFTYSTKYVHKYIAERIIQLWEIGREADKDDTRKRAVNLIREGLSRLMNMGIGILQIEKLLAEEYNRRQFLIGRKYDRERLEIDKVLSLT
jgi:hypothetical protein